MALSMYTCISYDLSSQFSSSLPHYLSSINNGMRYTSQVAIFCILHCTLLTLPQYNTRAPKTFDTMGPSGLATPLASS